MFPQGIAFSVSKRKRGGRRERGSPFSLSRSAVLSSSGLKMGEKNQQGKAERKKKMAGKKAVA